MSFKIVMIVLAFLNPSETEAFDAYVTGIRAQYEQVGATSVRHDIHQTLVGEQQPDFIMVVEFPNPQAVQQLFTSKAYQQLVPYRKKAFKKLEVFLSQKE